MFGYNILPAAEEEANDAFDWYESEQEGLGASFRAEVKLTLDRILQDPIQFQIYFGNNRSARPRSEISVLGILYCHINNCTRDLYFSRQPQPHHLERPDRLEIAPQTSIWYPKNLPHY
jgi:hypothetical protein